MNLQRSPKMHLRFGMLPMLPVKHAKLDEAGSSLGMVLAVGLLTKFGGLVEGFQRLGLAPAVQQCCSKLARRFRQACVVGLGPCPFQPRYLGRGLLRFRPLALIEMDIHQCFHGSRLPGVVAPLGRQIEGRTRALLSFREFALVSLCLLQVEQQVDTFFRRMTSLAQCQAEVLLRFAPIARRQMLLPRHPILMTLPMPFLNVGLNPNSKADAKAKQSRGAEHDYTVRSAGASSYFR